MRHVLVTVVSTLAMRPASIFNQWWSYGVDMAPAVPGAWRIRRPSRTVNRSDRRRSFLQRGRDMLSSPCRLLVPFAAGQDTASADNGRDPPREIPKLADFRSGNESLPGLLAQRLDVHSQQGRGLMQIQGFHFAWSLALRDIALSFGIVA